MSSELEYPQLKAIDSVLVKLGIDPRDRYDEVDQDPEYTTCVLDELGSYLKLYSRKATNQLEKRVLGCYFLECLNEWTQINESPHRLQSQILETMHKDIHIHRKELAYWSDTTNRTEEEQWPIANAIIQYKHT